LPGESAVVYSVVLRFEEDWIPKHVKVDVAMLRISGSAYYPETLHSGYLGKNGLADLRRRVQIRPNNDRFSRDMADRPVLG
jgi:hypothetical protein